MPATMLRAMEQRVHILRRRLLGTDATYRVVEDDGDDVLVEVIDVPGLPCGFRMHLTAAAVAEMELVTDAERYEAGDSA